MSRFRKVQDTNNIPNFIEKRFIGASVEIEDDPYAELKNNSTDNRMKIAKQSVGMQKEAANFDKSWEKISGASKYQDLTDASIADRILSQEFGSIKRADSYYDEGLSARTTTSGLKAYSADEYMDCMLRGSSNIFNPDMIAITEEFLNSQQSTSAQAVEDQNHRREAKASKHQSWEQKHSRSLREANVVSSRAHSILRTSSDSEHTSSFGMVDPNTLDERESLRLANINQAREQRLAIKKNIQEDIHNSSQNRAQTFSDVYRSIDISFDNLND